MVYTVEYKMYASDDVKRIDVIAQNKVSAYDKATYEQIPNIEHSVPYSSWVASVTYNNGNHHSFHSFEGKPY